MEKTNVLPEPKQIQPETLPDLGHHDARPFRLPDSIRWKNGVIFDPEDPYNVKLTHKGVQFRLDDDQDIKLMINFLLNGGVKANAQVPMMGGNINLDAVKTEDQRKLGANLNIPLLGGTLNANASRENGNNSAGFQYKRDF